MAQARSAARGGILADDMGLGKTMECLTWCVMERWMEIAWLEIREDRTAGTRKHLPSSPAVFDDACPSDHFFFRCPCEAKGTTSSWRPIRGITVVLAPALHLGIWSTEWQAIYDSTYPGLDMHLAIAHHSRRALPASHHDAIRMHRGRRRAQASNSQYILVTTTRSFGGHVTEAHRWLRPQPETPTSGLGARAYTPASYDPALHIARFITDEFHLQRSASSSTILLLESRPLAIKLFVSGTPIERGPKDVEGVITAMRGGHATEWSRHPALKRCTADSISALRKTFARFFAAKQPDRAAGRTVVKDFSALLGRFMIRRTVETNWFGNQLVSLPPHTPRDVKCSMNTKYAVYYDRLQDDALEQLKELRERHAAWVATGGRGEEPKLRSGLYQIVTFKLRLCTTVPALAKLVVQEGLQLTINDLYGKRWFECDDNPYFRNLDELVSSSAKLHNLKVLIEALRVDCHNRPEKLLIFCFSPTIAYIVYQVSHRFIMLFYPRQKFKN